MDRKHREPSMAELRSRIAVKRILKHRVAAKLDISASHLTNLLNGHRHATPEMAERIAEAIDAVARETAA